MISSSKEFKTEINTTYGSYNILYTSQSFQMCVFMSKHDIVCTVLDIIPDSKLTLNQRGNNVSHDIKKTLICSSN